MPDGPVSQETSESVGFFQIPAVSVCEDTGVEEKLDALKAKALSELKQTHAEPALQQLRARFLGRKGELKTQMKGLAALAVEQRREVGQALNHLKTELELAFDSRVQELRSAGLTRMEAERPDITLPGRPLPQGHIHPLTRVMHTFEDIFIGMGFDVEEGPEVEDDFHNFEALNLPPGHPARDMQDTFYLPSGLVLRTHTSPVQVHTMLRRDPPLRIIAPGAVYRCDMDVSHSPMFHQVEGLLVDEQVSLADLKGILLQFVREMFGEGLDVRFRASFFPFTEPSAEVDMSCFICGGDGCRTCSHTGWIEIGGCGMVNPAVFRKIGRPEYDPERIQGFAFGMGIERIAMLKYGFADIRQFFDNDMRMLQQF